MTVRTHKLISPAHDVHLIEFSYLFVVDRSPNRFSVVHSLALSEKLNFLCAADREHNRIQCFDTELQWKYDVNFDKPVFAAAFKPNTGQYSATCHWCRAIHLYILASSNYMFAQLGSQSYTRSSKMTAYIGRCKNLVTT